MSTTAKNAATAGIWRERVVAQQASGRSIRAWCRENDCHEHAFYCWRVRLGLSPVAGGRRRGKAGVGPVGFARVVVNTPMPPDPVTATPAEPIRVGLLGGRELTLPASMPLEQVARLIRAIERAEGDADGGAA